MNWENWELLTSWFELSKNKCLSMFLFNTWLECYYLHRGIKWWYFFIDFISALLILLNVNTWSLSRLKPTFLFHIRFREVVSILEPLEPIENVSGKHKLLLEYFFKFLRAVQWKIKTDFQRNVMVLDENFPSHVTTTNNIGAVALNLRFHFVDKILAERKDGFFTDFSSGLVQAT